jgi:hypothetical protein
VLAGAAGRRPPKGLRRPPDINILAVFEHSRRSSKRAKFLTYGGLRGGGGLRELGKKLGYCVSAETVKITPGNRGGEAADGHRGGTQAGDLAASC